jgi:SAM-dependent methyltransferase
VLRWRTPGSVVPNGPVGSDPPPTGPASAELVFTSRALASFLTAIAARPAPELVDLGPVIGSNIAFLGERTACKIRIEDLYGDLERHLADGTIDRFPAFLEARFPLAAASIDGVLCWDVFDCLDAHAGSALATELVRLLRPGGLLLAFFGTVARPETGYTKYVIEDGDHLRCRPYRAASGPRRALENRDIIRLFERLDVSHSVLLKSHLREMVFRKRGAGA